jgi:hypothetical protein
MGINGKPEREGVTYLRDADTIILVMAMRVQIVETVRQGSTVWFGFRSVEADPIVTRYHSNEPMPLEDARVMIWARNLFQTIVYESR